jgi:hypothetical protein
MALPAKKALPKPEITSAPITATGAPVGASARWYDVVLGVFAFLTVAGALGRLFMLIGGGE